MSRSVADRLSATAAVLVRDVWLNLVVSSYLVPRPLRWGLLRLSGLDVRRSRISAGCFFGGSRISIGEHTFLNYGAFLDGAGSLQIGARCDIGPRVVLLTGTHTQERGDRRAGAMTGLTTRIGDGTWIGAGATILPGVTVGEGCIIGAGAVVSRDCAGGGTYAGVPARRIDDR